MVKTNSFSEKQSTSTKPDAIDFDPSTTAILVVDMLKDFFTDGGAMVLDGGDILYEPVIIKELINSPGDIVLLVDSQQTNGDNDDPYAIHVEGEEPLSFQYGKKNWASIKKLSVLHNGFKSHGKWIGLIKLSNKGSLIFKDQINQCWKISLII